MRRGRRISLALVLTVSVTASPRTAAIAQNRPPQTSPPTAAISGVVVDAATQKPIAGAVVLLAGTPIGQAAPVDRTIQMTTSSTGAVVSTTLPPAEPFRSQRQITDELGRFLFMSLPGSFGYTVTASSLGYYDGAHGRRVTQGFAASAARRIALVDGQWFRDGRIELTRPASINGRVVDESGEPVVGVIVRAYTEIYVGGVRQVATSLMTTTDDRGIYRISGLTAGRYVVAVPSVQHAIAAEIDSDNAVPQGRTRVSRTDPEFAVGATHRVVSLPRTPAPAPSASGRAQVYPLTFYPTARTLAEATAIQLQSGDERLGIDLQLAPVPGFRIDGRLEGPPEAVAGMPLRLLPVGSEGLGRGSEVATSLTGVDGTFAFLNVPNGAYTIVANRSIAEYGLRPASATALVDMPNAPGAVSTSMSMMAADSGPAGTTFTRSSSPGDLRHHGRQSITVGGRDLVNIVVPLRAGVTMTGRVTYEFVKAVPPPTPPRLRAEAANGDPGLGQPSVTRNPGAPPLEFRIEGLLSGAYFLRAAGSPAMVKSIVWNGRDYTDTPFDASLGQDFHDVLVTLTDVSSTLTGQILDRQGRPAADSAVIAFPADRAKWTNYGIQPARLRSSAGSTTGSYTLGDLPAGDYLLVAVRDVVADRWKDPGFLEGAARVATRVPVALGETKTVSLTLQEIQ